MSFFDMIPSEYLTMPSGGHGTANLAHKNFGLLKDKCAYCGQTFYRRRREVLYIRYKDKKRAAPVFVEAPLPMGRGESDAGKG